MHGHLLMRLGHQEGSECRANARERLSLHCRFDSPDHHLIQHVTVNAHLISNSHPYSRLYTLASFRHMLGSLNTANQMLPHLPTNSRVFLAHLLAVLFEDLSRGQATLLGFWPTWMVGQISRCHIRPARNLLMFVGRTTSQWLCVCFSVFLRVTLFSLFCLDKGKPLIFWVQSDRPHSLAQIFSSEGHCARLGSAGAAALAPPQADRKSIEWGFVGCGSKSQPYPP